VDNGTAPASGRQSDNVPVVDIGRLLLPQMDPFAYWKDLLNSLNEVAGNELGHREDVITKLTEIHERYVP
jgi:hypothetical protein